jgi:hypothetical protein
VTDSDRATGVATAVMPAFGTVWRWRARGRCSVACWALLVDYRAAGRRASRARGAAPDARGLFAVASCPRFAPVTAQRSAFLQVDSVLAFGFVS